MDEMHRRYHSGKYSESEDFTPTTELNPEMKAQQKELDENFKGTSTEDAKKLRSKTRKVLDEMGE